MQTSKPIAVVGAGIAGAACARALIDRGFAVTLFDKSRGVGGRLATRRFKGWQWDHGAPVMNVSTQEFALASENLTSWRIGQAPSARIGVPTQNQLVKQLLVDVPVQKGMQVTQVRQSAAGADWRLSFEQHAPQTGWQGVISAIPAPQAQRILPLPPQSLAAVAMQPCWAVMFVTPNPVDVLKEMSLRGVPLEGTDIARLTAEHLKPGRPQGAGLYVLHATSQWSQAHLEDSDAEVADVLMAQLFEYFGQSWITQYVTAHRWRYAQTQTPLGQPYLLENGLGVCGDWCLGAQAEHGYLSGKALGENFLA